MPDAPPITLNLEDPPGPLNFKQECQTKLEFEVKKNPNYQRSQPVSLKNFRYSLRCLYYLNRYDSKIIRSSGSVVLETAAALSQALSSRLQRVGGIFGSPKEKED